MDLQQIKSFLDSPNPDSRMKAITELRHYEPDVVVPLLKQRMYDEQFLCRSLVAMGLGHKRNDEAFETLIEIVKYESDPNVISEAANSLGKFGLQAIPYLVAIFEQQSHWLVRQSVFATLEDIECPEALLKLCRLGFDGDDLTVKRSAVVSLGRLSETPQAPEALNILLQAATDNRVFIRAAAARTL
ncbi:MAG: HEAT repeat domain-containing protein, partial [Leptolyngbyaceae cyanobacterium MO_188.B28]|nr:HEAT repeat domain-containing protein [Leptolyngbyaceae cyanobacterium MO_188.B28]